MSTETMLDRWAAKLEWRLAIEDFLEWAERQGWHFAEWSAMGTTMHPVDESRRDFLNRYHEIDGVQLERERRALLESLPRAPKELTQ